MNRIDDKSENGKLTIENFESPKEKLLEYEEVKNENIFRFK
jgi:hypothetical protein